MKRISRQADGHYHIKGHTYENLIGSRRQVANKTAYKTSGNLTISDIILSKKGKWVSRKKHNFEKKNNRLVKLGFRTTSGVFEPFRKKSFKREK
jgi:hypothetical protein